MAYDNSVCGFNVIHEHYFPDVIRSPGFLTGPSSRLSLKKKKKKKRNLGDGFDVMIRFDLACTYLYFIVFFYDIEFDNTYITDVIKLGFFFTGHPRTKHIFFIVWTRSTRGVVVRACTRISVLPHVPGDYTRLGQRYIIPKPNESAVSTFDIVASSSSSSKVCAKRRALGARVKNIWFVTRGVRQVCTR